MSKHALSHTTYHDLMVDTSAIIAIYDTRDQFHQQALEFRDQFILKYEVRLFTSNYIYSEAMSHLTHLPSEKLREIDQLIHKPSQSDMFRIQELWVNKSTIDKALPIFFQYKEHNFSVTDCTSFILMHENKISAAFTFDSDYIIYTYLDGKDRKAFWKLPEMLNLYLSYLPTTPTIKII